VFHQALTTLRSGRATLVNSFLIVIARNEMTKQSPGRLLRCCAPRSDVIGRATLAPWRMVQSATSVLCYRIIMIKNQYLPALCAE